MTSICGTSSEILNNHPTCKAECNKLLAMKDSAYAKLKLECRIATKKLKKLGQENKALSAELRKMRHVTCTLQCEVQSLVEKCTTDLTTYPYMEEPSTYICQSLQPRNNETMLAELLRVENDICARYKAKAADIVDRLERELVAFKAQAASKRHDMIFNVNVKGRHSYPIENLTPAELDAQGTNYSVPRASG